MGSGTPPGGDRGLPGAEIEVEGHKAPRYQGCDGGRGVANVALQYGQVRQEIAQGTAAEPPVVPTVVERNGRAHQRSC